MALAYFKVSFLLVLLSTASFAQDQGDFDTPVQGGPDDVPQNGEMDEEMMAQIQKIMLWGCYFLTKNVMFNNIEELNQLMQLSPDHAKLYRKIIGDIMMECAQTASPYDMQQLISSYGQEDFDLDKYSQFTSFSIQKYENIDLSNMPPENEDPAFSAYYHIDQMIQEHAMRENPDLASEYEDYRGQYNEPTFAGLRLSDISSVMKIVFVCSSVVLIGSIIYNFLDKRRQIAAASGPAAPTDKKSKEGKSKETKEGKTKEAKATENKKEARTESAEKKKDNKKAKTE